MLKQANIMIVGVGGQGTLLASKLLGQLLLDEGFDVKVSELHGMSQRGGSVVTYVKYGETVYAPVIGDGEADFIVSFEKLEAARYVKCLKKGGTIITNSQQIDPMPVTSGACEYPVSALDELRAKDVNIIEFDALSVANEAGSSKAVNLVLVGRLSRYFDFPESAWQNAIDLCVPSKFLELNKKAFALGRE
jgi:indolepyruvate ferredoxin oxidoreductase beta subunit